MIHAVPYSDMNMHTREKKDEST